jgi:glycerol-3-phosphate cytidylyltransferase-like family protein
MAGWVEEKKKKKKKKVLSRIRRAEIEASEVWCDEARRGENAGCRRHS